MKIYEKQIDTVFVQVIERPARKLMVKWAKSAGEYFAYCEEVGCDIWGVLCSQGGLIRAGGTVDA